MRPRHPLLDRSPLLIAHRGGGGLAPENTLAAFRNAVSAWRADMLELDVQATADGACVVIHDATVDRTTDGSGRVDERTLDELRTLDAGYRFTPDGGATFPFRGAGERIPTFGEVLEAVPETPIVIELKTAAAQEPLLAAIRKHGSAERLIIAGSHESYRTLFEDWPGATSATMESLRRLLILHRLRLAKLWRPTADVANIPEYFRGRRVLTPRVIREIHAQGLPVHVWTVNEEDDMVRLLDWGVDGLLSDRLDRLHAVLAARVGRPPPPALG